MNGNRISETPATTRSRVAEAHSDRRPSMRARMTARLWAARFDAQLAVGVPAPSGTAIAARAARLTTTAERDAIARTLRRAVREVTDNRVQLSARVPLHRTNIAAAEPLIDAITLRLRSPLPVGARGMARLNRVLRDGYGPMYAYGRGDLTGRLGAALAAL